MTVNVASASFAAAHTADVDVIVIGDGVIGLSTALELARSGARCTLVGCSRPGAASGAAAGLLAPSVGQLPNPARPFFLASLARFPDFVASLNDFDRTLAVITGVVDVSSAAAAGHFDHVSTALSDRDVARLDPSLGERHGARVYERDGAIDNVRLVGALRAGVASHAAVRVVIGEAVVSIELSVTGGQTVVLASGTRISAETVVLAAGAWSPQLAGLPRPIPIRPLKGQMLALAYNGLRHPITGDDVYLVPRGSEVVIGATAELAGFDVSTIPEAIERMHCSASAICPPLANAPVLRTWAGLRPATPDLLPIIGRDPKFPRLIYACGHSKNGILLAPETAAVVAALALGATPTADLTPFSITRFDDR